MSLRSRPDRNRRFSADARGTPSTLLRMLDAEFGFTLDPCPFDESGLAGASLWGRDGLALDWSGERVFCNPPYSDIAPWMAKARQPEVAVYLVPARTDVGWWHEHALKADQLRFIRGRLRFDTTSGGAPFPSVLVIFDERRTGDPVSTSVVLSPEQRKGFAARAALRPETETETPKEADR